MWMTSTYMLYLGLSIVITVFVAGSLSRHGRVFLIDVFDGSETLADAVNGLLVVGFYLINIAFVTLTLKTAAEITSWWAALELLSSKIGLVLVILGGMHFFNLAVLTAVHRWYYFRRSQD